MRIGDVPDDEVDGEIDKLDEDDEPDGLGLTLVAEEGTGASRAASVALLVLLGFCARGERDGVGCSEAGSGIANDNGDKSGA